MPALGITGWPPPCARDHRAVVLSCCHLARRWAALERRLAWLVVDTQVKTCSRETHSPSRASKTYGHNAFQIIIIHTTVINSGRAHTTQHRTHCGLWLWLQCWLMPQSHGRLRNDLNVSSRTLNLAQSINQSTAAFAGNVTTFYFPPSQWCGCHRNAGQPMAFELMYSN